MMAFHPTHRNCYRFDRRLRTSHQHLPRVITTGKHGSRERAKGATCPAVPPRTYHCQCSPLLQDNINFHFQPAVHKVRYSIASLFQRQHAVHVVAAAAAYVGGLMDPVAGGRLARLYTRFAGRALEAAPAAVELVAFEVEALCLAHIKERECSELYGRLQAMSGGGGGG